MTKKSAHHLDVYIVDGSRTPFLKDRKKPGPFSASDMAVQTCRQLLARQKFSANAIDEVICGCTMPSPDEANIARQIALRLGCDNSIPAWTVMRNCASGMQAIDSAIKDIADGRHDLVLAGGVETMSRGPLLYNEKFTKWLLSWFYARSAVDRAKLIPQVRPAFFAPVIALLKGLNDPLIGMDMGQTAEEAAYQFGISREQMDAFALLSQQRARQAQEAGHFNAEITTIYDTRGNYYDKDDGIFYDTSLEKLASRQPVFDRTYGTVTAANSSQITDGAAFLILAGRQAVRKYHLPVIGRIVDVEWAGLDPRVMGLGPVHAVMPILQRYHYQLGDIDYWELNEAFAAQVLSCFAAWNDKNYCQKYLGLDKAAGEVDMTRVNVDGGAIALGHPVGATGTRLVLHLLQVLKRNNAKRGIATLCIGGGQGGAMLIENISEVAQ